MADDVNNNIQSINQTNSENGDDILDAQRKEREKARLKREKEDQKAIKKRYKSSYSKSRIKVILTCIIPIVVIALVVLLFILLNKKFIKYEQPDKVVPFSESTPLSLSEPVF